MFIFICVSVTIWASCLKFPVFSGCVFLTEGDTVTFGHLTGENIKAGTHVRQPNSEFQYIVSIFTPYFSIVNHCEIAEDGIE